MTAALHYAVEPSFTATLTSVEKAAIVAQAHTFKPIIKCLRERSAALLRFEDEQGTFQDTEETRFHVKAMKGARMDCDDITAELESLLASQ